MAEIIGQQVPEKKKGHPKGLGVLFTTEMWERFNFYGMRALLTLFLVNALAFKESEASIIYGGFLGLSYLTPMLGGFISDRYLGNRLCIMLGGLIMAIGQFLLFTSASTFDGNMELSKTVMWIALLVIIIGNGFFKPNISSMVGQLYPKGDNRLDSAFTIFYMGINVGAFLGMTICPLVGDVVTTQADGTQLRNVFAFKWGFLAAGIAMLLGTLIFFLLKDKYVVSADGAPIGGIPVHTPSETGEDSTEVKFSRKAITGAVLAFAGMVALFHFLAFEEGVSNWISHWVYPVIYASGITLAGLILTDSTLTKVERDRVIVMYFVAFFVIFFWACFEQAGSSLTFIANNQTDRNLLGWELPPSFIQNANSLFIIIFAIPFSFLWLKLSERNLEPMSTVKQSIGLLLLSLGFLIIASQVKDLGTTGKLGVIWLIVMYFFHTIGELCLSPIGLSLVAKLAPKKYASLLMGVWFLANAAGYALAGTLGSVLPPTSEHYITAQKEGIDLKGILDQTVTPTAEQLQWLETSKIATTYPTFAGFTITNLFEFFMIFVTLSGIAGILLFLISGWLKKMMHGVR